MKRYALGLALCASLAGAGLGVACVGDDSTGTGGGPTPDGGSTTDGGTSGNGDDAAGTDSGSGGPGACVASCATTADLSRCEPDGAAQSVHCAYDCSGDGGAHCRAFVPDPPMTAADMAETAMLGVLDFTATGFVSTDDGSIAGVRVANKTASTHEVVGGIGFHVVNGVGVFTAKSIVIEPNVTMMVRGKNALAFVADTITVTGVIDARGWDANGLLCNGNTAGPGGFAGGDGTTAGLGPGAGAAGANVAVSTNGAGGGGGGANGGAGGNAADFGGGNGAGAKGGAIVAFAAPIRGGSGGGSCPVGAVPGGGGGGAIELVAVTRISIGGGATAGGINAGGCHGTNGSTSSGGGGGAGGTIVLASPSLSMLTNAVLAANGGGGGGAGTNPSPTSQDGLFSALPANGTSGVGIGQAGAGAAGLSYAGVDGLLGMQKAGGAGGGGAGRIVFRNLSGSFSVPGGAIVSPTPPGGPVVMTRIDLE